MREELSKQEMMKFFQTALLFTPVDYEAGVYRHIKIMEYLIISFCEDDELLKQNPIPLLNNIWYPYNSGDDKIALSEIELVFEHIISFTTPKFEKIYKLELDQMIDIFRDYEESLDYHYMREYISYHHEMPEYQISQI
jgi:hypothetical protein